MSVGHGLEVVQYRVGGVAREPAAPWTRSLERSLCYSFGGFGNQAIQVAVRGPNPTVLNGLVDQVTAIVRNTPGAVDVNNENEKVQREFLVKALAFYEKFADSAGSSPEVRLEAAKALRRVGEIQRKLGDTKAGEDAFQRSTIILRALDAEKPDPAVRLELMRTLNRVGWLQWALGHAPEAALTAMLCSGA